MRAGEQARQVGGVVGEVGVHLDDEICAARQRLAKARDVGGAETLLARPVKHRDVLVRRCEPLGDLPGAVGRGVIDDQDPPWLAEVLAHRGDNRLEVGGLVVRGEDEPDLGSLFSGPVGIQPILSRRLSSPAMLATYWSFLVVFAASCLVGQGVFALCGRRQWSWLAPAVGLSVLTAVAWGTVRLPGEGAASSIVIGALTLACLAFLIGRIDDLGDSVRVGLSVAVVACSPRRFPFSSRGASGSSAPASIRICLSICSRPTSSRTARAAGSSVRATRSVPMPWWWPRRRAPAPASSTASTG